MTHKIAGAIIIGVWTVARVFFWRVSKHDGVVRVDMPPRRRSLLVLVSASLVPIYAFYFTTVLDPYTLPASTWVRWSGTGLLGAAVALFMCSHAALGSNWTVDVAVAQHQSLVVAGPYRWVRHPMYAALILMGIALVPATANLVASLPYLSAIVALYAERVRDEERLMLEEFGDAYTSYMDRTGRIVPRIGPRGRRQS